MASRTISITYDSFKKQEYLKIVYVTESRLLELNFLYNMLLINSHS